MKQQYEIGIRLSDDLLRRLLYISEAENRSPSAEIAFLLRNNAAYFERAKGKIDTKKLASYDLTPYRAEERPRTGETDGKMPGDATVTESTTGKATANTPGVTGEREDGNGNP